MSESFKDTSGREWNLHLTVADARRIASALDVNLLRLDEALFVRLFDDVVLLVDIMWCIVRQQADERKVDEENFGRSLGGDSLYAATEALLESIVNFTPNPHRRAFLAKAMGLLDRVQESASERIENILDNPDLLRELTTPPRETTT